MKTVLICLLAFFLTACGTVPQELKDNDPRALTVCVPGSLRVQGGVSEQFVEELVQGTKYRVLGVTKEGKETFLLLKAEHHIGSEKYFLVHPVTGEVQTSARFFIKDNPFITGPTKPAWGYQGTKAVLKVAC